MNYSQPWAPGIFLPAPLWWFFPALIASSYTGTNQNSADASSGIRYTSQELRAVIPFLVLSPENSRCSRFAEAPTLSPQLRETARLCLGWPCCCCSLEALKAVTARLPSFVSLLLGISVLCCLLFKSWKLFHIFLFVILLLLFKVGGQIQILLHHHAQKQVSCYIPGLVIF